jgi:polar amino acid transport system substrate-binding protein
MFKFYIKITLLIVFTLTVSNCTTTTVEHTKPEPFESLLVGVTPNYPPIMFKQGDEFAGVEADLARLLAIELGKPVKFVELKWDKQIPALLNRETDIIMSGMSITKARGIRVNFADHYLKSGLVAMMLIEYAETYQSVEDVMQNFSTVGVVKGTTSEVFVRKNFPNLLNVIALQEADDAPSALNRRSIDVFIHDAPSIMWLVSENEAKVTALWEPLNEEHLAWAVRHDDEKLLMQVNSILNKWKNDGTLEKTLLRWLPSQYLERFK